MILNLSETVREKVGHSIIITGSGRSGTTILGKCVHSFDKVEYIYEPPLLVSLMPLINQISMEQWRLLYETYLYEDFFCNTFMGRSINCNRIDDSSIYRVKSAEDVERRLNSSLRKLEIERLTAESVIAYKFPGALPYLHKVTQYYPNSKVIIIKRNAVETINSLISKKWYSDDILKGNLHWPYRMKDGFRIPYWVRENDALKWVNMSEVDRCAYYYITANEDAETIEKKIEIRYSELLDDPLRIIQDLSKRLNLNFGPKTKEIINDIAPTTKKRDFSILDKISPDLRDKVLYYSERS
nr:sulfotransferase [uncultured Desulfobacter sp.]